MPKLAMVAILATIVNTASATPVVFDVHFEFDLDDRSGSPTFVTGTITADPATDSVIDTDLFLLGSLHTPDRPKKAIFESIGDGWSVTDTELSLRQDASNSEWRFRAYFYCGSQGGCFGHSQIIPHHNYYFELFPEGHSGEYQATLAERLSSSGGGGEELVAAHSDSSLSGRHAHLQLPMNSSGTGFLVGKAVPEPSSLALLLLGMLSTCRSVCCSSVQPR